MFLRTADGQKTQVTGIFDRHRHVPLFFGGDAGNTTGNDLAALGRVTLQKRKILVIDFDIFRQNKLGNILAKARFITSPCPARVVRITVAAGTVSSLIRRR